MGPTRSSSKMTAALIIPCDYCSKSTAVIYCRADSARLCLLCDRHVHSANNLSLKHVRSHICGTCSSQPATVRCSTESLSLCFDCDIDSHKSGSGSESQFHARSAIDSFTGCPSALRLAAAWGFDLAARSKPDPGSDWCDLDSFLAVDPVFQDLYVPCAKRSGSVLLEQLMELANRDSECDDVVAEAEGERKAESPVAGEMRPKTPCRGTDFDGGEQEENYRSVDQMPFTSLLMMAGPGSGCGDVKGRKRVVEDEELMWNCGPASEHCTQVLCCSRLLVFVGN